jgi:hypothetical protein
MCKIKERNKIQSSVWVGSKRLSSAAVLARSPRLCVNRYNCIWRELGCFCVHNGNAPGHLWFVYNNRGFLSDANFYTRWADVVVLHSHKLRIKASLKRMRTRLSLYSSTAARERATRRKEGPVSVWWSVPRPRTNRRVFNLSDNVSIDRERMCRLTWLGRSLRILYEQHVSLIRNLARYRRTFAKNKIAAHKNKVVWHYVVLEQSV